MSAADIKQKLDRLNIRANAALGQNFLCDDAMIEKIAFATVGDGKTDFTLELTWLRDHPQKYDLGECEFHLAMAVEDMEKAHALHEKLGCICYENPAMGIYFISDPDGYWIEIVPAR